MNLIKKILQLSFCFLFISCLMGNAQAVTDPTTPTKPTKKVLDWMNDFKPDYLPWGDLKSDKGAETFTMKFLAIFIDFMIYLSGTLATIGLIVGGAQYMFSFGGDGKESGKKTLIWSLVGLAVVMLSYAIVHNVVRLLLFFSEES